MKFVLSLFTAIFLFVATSDAAQRPRRDCPYGPNVQCPLEKGEQCPLDQTCPLKKAVKAPLRLAEKCLGCKCLNCKQCLRQRRWGGRRHWRRWQIEAKCPRTDLKNPTPKIEKQLDKPKPPYHREWMRHPHWRPEKGEGLRAQPIVHGNRSYNHGFSVWGEGYRTRRFSDRQYNRYMQVPGPVYPSFYYPPHLYLPYSPGSYGFYLRIY